MNVNKLRKQLKNTNNKGFTLIELLLYMGLFTVLLVVLTDLFVATINISLNTQANTSVDQDGRYILARFAYDINRADSITTPSNPGNNSGTLILSIGGDSYTYTTNAQMLQITNSQGTDILNSTETTISGLNFQRLGNVGGDHSIRIEFTLTSKAKDNAGQEVQSFETTVAPR